MRLIPTEAEIISEMMTFTERETDTRHSCESKSSTRGEDLKAEQ